jgi:hypothetical protein
VVYAQKAIVNVALAWLGYVQIKAQFFSMPFRKTLIKSQHVASLIFRSSALAYELSVKLGVLRYVFFAPAGILGDVDLPVAPGIS